MDENYLKLCAMLKIDPDDYIMLYPSSDGHTFQGYRRWGSREPETVGYIYDRVYNEKGEVVSFRLSGERHPVPNAFVKAFEDIKKGGLGNVR